MLRNALALALLFSAACLAQFGLAPSGIFPQVADGAGWKTTFFLVNDDTVPLRYELAFYSSTWVRVPLIGSETGASGLVAPKGLAVVETPGTASEVRQGFAQILTATNRVTAYAILRQRVPGRSDYEVVLGEQGTSGGSTKAAMFPFDNTQGFATAIAMAETTGTFRAVLMTFRNESGLILGSETINFPPGEHVAFSIPERFPYLVAVRGTAEIQTLCCTVLNVAALVLRFNPTGPFAAVPLITVP